MYVHNSDLFATRDICRIRISFQEHITVALGVKPRYHGRAGATFEAAAVSIRRSIQFIQLFLYRLASVAAIKVGARAARGVTCHASQGALAPSPSKSWPYPCPWQGLLERPLRSRENPSHG